jgi:hypothetical protein
MIGQDASPKDLAVDGLGCAESLSTILRGIMPTFPVVTGTWSLWDVLRGHADFWEVDTPERGDIILSVTGTGFGVFPGHTGVVSDDAKVMSNDSADGIWRENYTLESWKDRYELRGGFKTRFFRLV